MTPARAQSSHTRIRAATPRPTRWDAAGQTDLTTTHPTVTQPREPDGQHERHLQLGRAVADLAQTKRGTLTQLTYFSSGSKKGLLQKMEIDPSGLDIERTFDYDAAGNRTSVTDPAGATPRRSRLTTCGA